MKVIERGNRICLRRIVEEKLCYMDHMCGKMSTIYKQKNFDDEDVM